jgi:ribosomal protein L29
MKAKELMEKDDKALNKLLSETQAKLVKDRFAIAGREMTNVAEVNKSRKLVAKIKTILRQREILAVEKVAAKAKAEKGDK